MADRFVSRPLWPLAAIAALLLLFASAAATPDLAQAQKCKPVCLPPPEEEPGEPEGGGGNPPPTPKLLVLNLGWNTGAAATSAPLVGSELSFYANYFNGPVNEWFRNAAPGLTQGWKVVSGGSYAIEAPKALVTSGCSAGARSPYYSELFERGDAAARAHGIDPSLYDVVVYGLSRAPCDFGTLSDGFKARRIAVTGITGARHELGHHFGLPDANSLGCVNGFGERVTLSSSCATDVFGDPFDTMGSGGGLFNAVYENALGWMPNQVVDVSAGDFVRRLTLRPFSEPGESPRALRLVDGSTTLWLEYRQPTGLDAPQVSGGANLTYGLLVHRQAGGGPGVTPTSQLLDMSPGTGFADPGLRVGQTWANPLGEMKITLNSAGPAGATVTISSQRISMPSLLGDTAAGAEEAIAAAGLTSAGWSSVVDPTCALIGAVAAQSPSPGTRVLPGTPVRFWLGERDPTRECL